jgi:rhomboid family GlyGly-CTERM serine protease
LVNAGRILERTGVTKQRLADWAPIVALLAICLVLAFGGDEWRRLGRYDRVALEGGEYWRLVSGHLVHLSWAHLWPNLAALAVIGALFQDTFRASDWMLAAIVSATAIDAGLYLLDPELQWYVGLSGVLHGFVAAGAVEWILRRQTIGWVLAIGLVGKLVYEQTIGAMPFSTGLGGDVIVAAHLYGATSAAAWAAAVHFVRDRRSRV